MTRITLFIINIITHCLTLSAQEINLNVGQAIKLAEKAAKQNRLEEAAKYYEAAWSKKPKKLEWLNEAGLAYLKLREYRKAAEAFGTLKDNKFFPKARLLYAQSLQQSGQYDEAIPEFLLYLNSYNGQDREQVAERIEEHINGCALAIRCLAAKSDSITIEHLSGAINSPTDEVAPLPFSDDIVYFTSLRDGQAKIYRSQLGNTEWSNPTLANLPIPAGVAYGNGVFSADKSRFYYTQCQTIKHKKEPDQLTCAIFMLQRTGNNWSEPIRLPEPINTEGGMTTQPAVFEKEGKEYLFFVSDRKGGFGGMDIWQTSRPVRGTYFAPPQNLGRPVNTDGDDVTPHYDPEENVLYYASNGRATFGGFDIFKSKGFNRQWFVPENMGTPVNSGADDWYFIKNTSRTGGFLISNRAFGIEKINSRDDDIFAFLIKENPVELAASGQVFEKEDKTLVENARVSLFEKRDRSEPRLLSSIMTGDGSFTFTLLPQKKYTIEVEKDGYRLASFEISTLDSNKNINRNFFLEKYALFASNKLPQEKTIPNARINERPSEITAKNTDNPQKTPDNKPMLPEREVRKKPTREIGISYKIQLMAYEEMTSTNSRRLSRVEDLGDFDMETVEINGKRLTRVMLSDFETYNEAVKALKKVKDRALDDAFIIRYENGKRTNKSR